MSPSDKVCFVVMGFGKKTDFQTGRVLDLDKSYRSIIKPAVEAAGLKSIRADEIVHSGIIDVPMYQHLLTADVVIADLSTYNSNAFYELGVRHALRPFATITIAESKLVYPFDVNHTVIQPYEHLGTGIDFEEVMRMRQVLETAIRHLMANPQNDSPVYQFLHGLRPPVLAPARSEAADEPPGVLASVPSTAPTVAVLMEQVETARQRQDWVTARALLTTVRQMMKDPSGVRPEDPHIIQQLALATYKSQLPTPELALQDALRILQVVNAAESHDPETLGLSAAIHKRLWQLKELPADLDAAIEFTQRGFLLRGDYYNGINLAFLFNVRSSISEGAEAVTDFVLARRTRRAVVEICNEALASPEKLDPEDRYWILSTLAEAWCGLEEPQQCEDAKQQAYAIAPKAWMKESTEQQLARLQPLLENSPLVSLGLTR